MANRSTHWSKRKMNRFLMPVNAMVIGITFLFSAADARVIINEFMAANVGTYPDLWDYEDFPDWIELYNDSTDTADLSGYYLTDNFRNAAKWALPMGAFIPAKGFLVVLADGCDAAPGVEDTRPYFPFFIPFITRNYHANFKLSDDSEEIGLYRRTGAGFVLMDSVVFTQQLPDVSMGRNSNDHLKWYQYDEPTPGAANTTQPKKTLKYASSVLFSIPGGFYNATQTISLSAVPNTPIYYTANGSAPTVASNRYSSPITIDATAVIRARCIDSTLLAGPVTTNTYLIGEKKRSLMVVSIVADSSFLWDSAYGIYKNSLKGREIPASLEFFNDNGKQAVKVQAGISPGSLTSYMSPQKPLQVSLKGKYGDDFIWYQLFGKQIACFARLRFRNSGDSWETNLMADGLVETICKGQMNNASQAYRPVVIYLNGEYWGIQDMREQFDPQFFTSNFNVDPTTLNDVRTTILPPWPGHEGWEVTEGTWDDYRTLMSLVQTVDMDDPSTFAKIDSLMDVNSFIDFISAEDYAVNISWGHNIEIWKVQGTPWRWLLADFDRGFMLRRVDINLFTNGGRGMSGSIIPKDTLFTALINNAEFKSRFLQRFAAHLNSTFHPARMTAIIDSIANLLEPEMPDHIERWKADTGIQSMEEWRAEVADMKEFAMQRPAIVFEQLAEHFELEGTARLTVMLSKANAGDIFASGVRMCNGTDSMTYFKGIPLHLKVVARPGYAFAGWNGAGGNMDTLSLALDHDDTLTAVFEESGVHTIPSVISSNTTFDKTDFPYVAKGDVLVEKGAALTVAEGVTVLMSSKAGIYVQGRLLVKGSVEKPIRIEPDTANGAARWGAICFEGAEDTCKIEYAVISGTTMGRDALNHKAGISGNNSHVVMDHLTMSNVIYPLYFEGGSTVLRNSSITIDHICNGGIHIGRGAALVENNRLVSTGKTVNTDAVDIKGVDKGIIRGNRIYNFNGFNSDGIDCGENATNILIEGNRIYGSRDKGISVGGGSICMVKNNIVAACDMGIGVKDSGSFANLDRNTFVRNNKGIAVYEKVFPRGGGSVIARNMIISASKLASVEADETSSLEITYSLSDMDLLAGEGNTFGDPRFVDLQNNNFQVAEGSMSINAGDPGSPNDPDGSRADIGAAYKFNSDDFPHSVTGRYVSPVIVINEIMHKDASKDSLLDWIELYNPDTARVNIGHWSVSDEDTNRAFTIHSGSAVDSGGYLVICRDTVSFKRIFPAVKNIMGNLAFGLGASDRIVLADSGGNEVTFVRYTSEAPWPKETDGKGPSLELINPGNVNHLTLNWGASKNSGGTPGSKNSIAVKPSISIGNYNHTLFSAYPNPLKSFATISFIVLEKSRVTINIFSINGKKLETLLDTELKQGSHRVRWSARAYSSGIYFCRIKTNRFTQTWKLFIQ